jgi:Domain of unknown function (DUF5602)
MKRLFFTLPVIVGAMMTAITSCNKEVIPEPQEIQAVAASKDVKTNVFKGPVVQLADGRARSWIRITHEGVPEEIGVELTDAALMSLPHENVPLVLPLHMKAREVTPFDHIGFNYMHEGHFPPGVFDVPHFDVHFYMQSVEERLAIPMVTPATLPLFMLAPPAGYMPATYSPAGPEPQMGLHWAPPPPTFMPFTRVMIYGSYNGALTFIEPMVTVQHLMGAGSTNPYLQPSKFAEAGYYPTVYNVYKDPQTGNHYITLTNFVYRTAN